MSASMAMVWLAFKGVALALLLAVVGVFVIALSAGPGVAAGERAAMVALGLDILLWIATGVRFWLLSAALGQPARIAATLLVLIVAGVLLAALFLLTLVLLNR